MTEYQNMLYRDLGSVIRRHYLENDLTSVEIIGIMEIIVKELKDEEVLLRDYSDDGD